MQPVLDSIGVVEATEALAGPYCAMMLGDFGADVIKVERKKVGDQSQGGDLHFAARNRPISSPLTATSGLSRSILTIRLAAM